MPSITSSISTPINFIADLPKYKVEKPFTLHTSKAATLDPEGRKATNVEWLPQSMEIRSMRGDDNISLDRSGFCYVEHKSNYLPSSVISDELASLYCKETEELVASSFNPELTICYDFKVGFVAFRQTKCAISNLMGNKLRKNLPVNFDQYDHKDPLFVEQSALGAHDISLDAAPQQIKRLLSEDQMKIYSQPGYRFRLVNTWRCLLPKCEDRPLALCDYSSLGVDDVLAIDRVHVTRRQETYYVKHNKNQQWYWLPEQGPDELLMFMTYDSVSDNNARYCPHAAIDNPLAPSDAPPRESVETRTLVITKV